MGAWDLARRPAVRVGVGTAALLAALGVLSADEKSTARSSLGVTVSPTAARGDLIRRGAATDERVALGTQGHVLTAGASDPEWSAPAVTSSQITDSTSSGRSLLTAAGAAAARAVLYPYPIELLTGAEGDWSASTTSPAGSTVTVSEGQVSLTIPNGGTCDFTSGGCATDAARAHRTLAYITASNWSLRARIASTGTSAQFVPMFGVMCGASWATSTPKYVVYFAANSDTATLARYAAAGAGIGSASITGLRAGEGWLRLDGQGRTITAYGGAGVGGTEPTSWTIITTATLTVTDSQPQRIFMGAHASSPATPQTIVWDSVRIREVE